jgi:hypothetical protein
MLEQMNLLPHHGAQYNAAALPRNGMDCHIYSVPFPWLTSPMPVLLLFPIFVLLLFPIPVLLLFPILLLLLFAMPVLLLLLIFVCGVIRSGVTFLPTLLLPESRGSITLSSADPMLPPRIQVAQTHNTAQHSTT